MAYEIRWSKYAERFLAKLPENIARRIAHKVDELKEVPFRFLERYEVKDFYKLRVGSHRLLVNVDLPGKVISIRFIGHRRNIYKDK